MDKTDEEIARVVIPVSSPVNTDGGMTLRGLYEAKREALNLSDRQVGKILGMDPNTLKPILDGGAKQVNFVNLVKLAHFLGLTVEDIAKVYVPEMGAEQIAEIQRARDAGYIFEHFDVSALTKIRFFRRDSSAREMGTRVARFFGLDSLYDYSGTVAAAFSRTRRNSSDLMRSFWVQSAYTQFEGIANPNPYDRDALKRLVPKMRPFTRDVKDGFTKVAKALYGVGVTVIYQPSLGRTQVRGATMCVSGKPCVVVSNLNHRYPTLWFTLLHELHHVLFDFEDIERQAFHVSDGVGDVFLMDEERADNFARDFLLSPDRRRYVAAYIRSASMIDRLASSWGVHPSVIYAVHCYDSGEWARYGNLIPKMDEALELFNTHPFDRETLAESVREIRELIYY